VTYSAVAIGECMLELSDAGNRTWRMSTAGDTYNTSVYLSRLGVRTAYLTALGTDPFSAEMRQTWEIEGLDTSLVLTAPDRLPGLYAIRNDEIGERSFFYWREQSAVRSLFSLPGIDMALASAGRAQVLYLSGITLSLFDRPGLVRLAELCTAVHAQGGDVAFDPNYRPRGWRDPSVARATIAEFAPLVTIALPTLEDEVALHSEARAEETIERWRRSGAREIAVKMGPQGCIVADAASMWSIPTKAASALDTTGAGDSFNAGYLAARRAGRPLVDAAAYGNRLAGEVIRHLGAIMPREQMPALSRIPLRDA